MKNLARALSFLILLSLCCGLLFFAPSKATTVLAATEQNSLSTAHLTTASGSYTLPPVRNLRARGLTRGPIFPLWD